MYFWTVTALLTLAAIAMLARAMLRGSVGDRPPAAYDLDVYRDQLREVDRDLARGVVSEADADRVRAEVSRRILAADAQLQKQEQKLDGSGGYISLALTVGAIVVGSYFIYNELGAPGYGDLALADRIETAQLLREERPSQANAEASVGEQSAPVNENPDYVALVERLRQAITTRPNDIEGHELLSRAEGRLGNFAAAHAAKAKVIQLKGPDATATDFSEYADLLILAAGGYVSPEAENVLERVLSMDPTDGPARYYYGLMNSQTGRPDTALRIWDQLLREGPADAPWIGPVSAQIEDIAMRAGVNYALPAIGTGRGPDAAQIEAAQDLSPSERMEMIQGMVSGLSDRLATEGGPVEDWAQLISALGVLGQMDQARAILINARDVFGDDPRAADILSEVADRVGLE
ncbi:c-type cytochrome biogenesis protein CcmI [Tateyamaria sp. ANG-S1]|uniref:c-type cytochrome biogenesis protein CcmI n=1 Tax=Tateyamaria sp. ANG-S1 TaxID=1577905 RepID=UPI0005800CF1|nr:c-type cytochrome biogenesis protein CcmI [Tateyamaria sp. ANG-S1]KIC51319.1 cytochrome C [Tateyamaria sp. ANG-S1]